MRYISPIAWPQCPYTESFGEPLSPHHLNTWIFKLHERQLSVTCEACGWTKFSNLHQVPDVDIKDKAFYDQKAREIGVTDWSQMFVVVDVDADGMLTVLQTRSVRM